MIYLNNNLKLSNIELFSDGSVRSGFPKQEYHFNTDYGTFKAQHTNDDARKQTINSLEFFECGNLRKISLEKQTTVQTIHGEIPAELILFYNSKEIRKIFPLNGKITGYWSEKDEYKLADQLEFIIDDIHIKGKFINIEFYENQALKSLLLWPNETMELDINNEKIKIKNKITFYENGKIKSIEPVKSVLVDTVIGKINVFNTASSGLGYGSTVIFDESGNIKELNTSSDKFEIKKDSELIAAIEPEMQPSMCNDKILVPQAINIKFENEYVSFDDAKYELAPHEIYIYNNAVRITNISCCG